MKINAFASLILAFIISSCASISTPAATPSPTQIPPTLTFTPIPIKTSLPTSTLSPTPTETETPTLPPGPVPTPIKLTSNNAILVPEIGSPARSIVWSRDGNYLFIGTYEKGLAIYDVVHKKLFPLVGNNANVSSLAISPDGKTLGVGLADDGSIRLWTIENIHPVYELQTIFPAHQEAVNVLAFSPDGKLIASGSDDGKVFVWDVKTGKMIKKFEEGIVLGLVFSPDGKTLIAGLSIKEEFNIWSTDTWELQNTFSGDQTYGLAISADGNKIVSAGGGIHEANLWDVKTGKLLFKFEKNTEGMALAVSYDPSGKLVALGGGGDTVFLWDISNGSLVWELNTTLDFTQTVAFSPDGSQIATGGSLVRIWNLNKP